MYVNLCLYTCICTGTQKSVHETAIFLVLEVHEQDLFPSKRATESASWLLIRSLVTLSQTFRFFFSLFVNTKRKSLVWAAVAFERRWYQALALRLEKHSKRAKHAFGSFIWLHSVNLWMRFFWLSWLVHRSRSVCCAPSQLSGSYIPKTGLLFFFGSRIRCMGACEASGIRSERKFIISWDAVWDSLSVCHFSANDKRLMRTVCFLRLFISLLHSLSWSWKAQSLIEYLGIRLRGNAVITSYPSMSRQTMSREKRVDINTKMTICSVPFHPLIRNRRKREDFVNPMTGFFWLMTLMCERENDFHPSILDGLVLKFFHCTS